MSYSAQEDSAPAPSESRNFNLLWFGEGVSIYGTATTGIALPLFAISQLHAGPSWMGLLTAATWLPWLVLGLPAGAWVDRLSPQRVMLTANLLSALALLSLPIAWRGGWITLPQVVVVALLLGVASMFFRTTYAKFIPAIVSKQRLEQANSRLLGTESAMQLTGRGTAGYLIE